MVAVGTFTVKIEVSDGLRERFIALEPLVDSGSTFTWIPRRVLLDLGYSPRFRIPLRLADGRRIERDAAEGVPIRIMETVREAVCIFAEDDEPPLLGATTLENHLLAVDPVVRRLMPVEALAMGFT